MENDGRVSVVEREAVKKLIDDMIVAVKHKKGATADLALRALGIRVCALPEAEQKPAKWERFNLDGSNTPYWRCSVCKNACFAAPDGLDRVYYCPRCGAYTGGIVDGN